MKRRKRLTIEQHGRDCLDVRDLRRHGFFNGGWVTIEPMLSWPRIARLTIARYVVILDLRGQGVPQRIRVSWTKVHLGMARQSG